MSLRVFLSPVAVLTLAATAGCVGATSPAPATGTTTITSAGVVAGESDRDAALSRARRRLEVAAREIGVLERELSRHRPDEATRTRDVLRRADQRRAELEREVAGLTAAPPASWSAERRDALDVRLDELDDMLELARK